MSASGNVKKELLPGSPLPVFWLCIGAVFACVPCAGVEPGLLTLITCVDVKGIGVPAPGLAHRAKENSSSGYS